MIFKGAATPSSVVNFSIVALPVRCDQKVTPPVYREYCDR
jgi:hypothetical protein